MNTDFPRVLTLLRKERNISQKQAAAELGISQALLSHYEKGIRECGLDFLIRCANFYGVSCDYLLGRSPDRTGTTLTVEDIPEPDASGKENTFHRGGILPVLNKKLIANSLNILFDLLGKADNKALTGEVSSFLMLAVYRMFRVVYSINPKNQLGLFTVPGQVAQGYASAAMQLCEANASAIAGGNPVEKMPPVERVEDLAITTEMLSQHYPLFASSLLNLIQNSENKIKG
ncbi:helix-turn-helix domain-containing protein [Merdimmobilis hominis]|uniref:HTH-type transcriptional regulator ImmR n=1 Tax=uncultured Anaerotruncus sp. TaxID=905011 RepID=A0A6N2V596_9FIRM|nr:helix-turn-helix domain-containing protein [Merdimmobilis hominis]MCD4837027.1 helix-turn-helix domain-containing protein [Merdimmobilis hominis]PWL63196.1 MAG: XRE family transcriptional regulator [Oscillospiraceae bacterium]PWL64725.1 MAG: XRE family transcriptional regulator [Oscillospiraceae bacterium]